MYLSINIIINIILLHKKTATCISVLLYSSYAMFPVDHKLWSTMPPAPISLSRRERIFLTKCLISHRSLDLWSSSLISPAIPQQPNNLTTQQPNNKSTTTRHNNQQRNDMTTTTTPQPQPKQCNNHNRTTKRHDKTNNPTTIQQ